VERVVGVEEWERGGREWVGCEQEGCVEDFGVCVRAANFADLGRAAEGCIIGGDEDVAVDLVEKLGGEGGKDCGGLLSGIRSVVVYVFVRGHVGCSESIGA